MGLNKAHRAGLSAGTYVIDAYTTEDLVFHWRTDAIAVEMNPNISLPEYTITNVTHLVCSKNFSSTGQ